MIPEESGRIKIPRFHLCYFDPDRAQYATVETEPVDLLVQQGQGPRETTPYPLLSRGEVRLLGEDVRHIKPDVASLEDHGRPLYGDARFLSLQAVPLVGFLGALLYRRHRERILGDAGYARRRRSKSEAKRRLAEARRLMKEGKDGPFYAEVYRALVQFLADRLNLAPSAILGDSADEILAEQGVPAELTAQVRGVLQQCDMARFSPAGMSNGDMKRLCQRTGELIEALGKVI